MSKKRIVTFLIACLMLLPCFATWAAAEDAVGPFKVGEAYFATLSAAAEAVAENGTIEVVADMTVSTTDTITAKKTFTVKGVKKEDGKFPQITVTLSATQGVYTNPAFFFGTDDVDNTGMNVTFCDINFEETNSGFFFYISKNATVTFGEGAWLKNSNGDTNAVVPAVVVGEDAKFTLDGGEMYQGKNQNDKIHNGLVRLHGVNSKLILNDGVMYKVNNWMVACIGENCAIEVNKIGILNAQGIYFGNTGASTNANKKVVFNIDNEVFTIMNPSTGGVADASGYNNTPRHVLTRNGEYIGAYYKFANAYKAAQDGDTIHVLATSASDSYEFTEAKAVTLDAHRNIFTTSSSTGLVKVGENATITLKNWNITNNNAAKVSGKLTLSDGVEIDASESAAKLVNDGAILNILKTAVVKGDIIADEGVTTASVNIASGTVVSVDGKKVGGDLFAAGNVTMRLPADATVANSGIAFGATLNKAEFDKITGTVATGTLITGKKLMAGASVLDLWTSAEGATKVMNLANTGWYDESETSYVFYGSLVNMFEKIYNEEFVSISYVSYKVGAVSVSVYSAEQSGIVSKLAASVVTKDANGNLLGTEEQRTVLAGYIPA